MVNPSTTRDTDLLSLIERNAVSRADKVAFIFENERLTFGEFADRVRQLAAGFRSRGIGQGDHVLLAHYQGNVVPIIYFALQWLGAVPVLASFSLLDDLAGLAEDTDSVAVVYGPRSRLAAEHLINVRPEIRLAVRVDSDGPGEAISQLFADGAIAPWDRRLDDPSGIVFTAGTTGRPKPIVRTYKTDLWDAIQKVFIYRLGFSDVWLYISPLNLTALLGPTRPVLLTGSTYSVINGFDARHVAEICARDGVTQLTLLGNQWAELLELPGLDRYDLSALRQIAVSASAAPADLKRRLAARFGRLPLLHVYGTSEAGLIAAAQDGDDQGGAPGCVGRPLPTVEARICGANGEALPVGEIGEISVTGPCLAPGYYRRPEATARAFRSGWNMTGDLGRIDKDGYLYVVDRASDVFVWSGLTVYPSLVQEALFSLPDVQEGAFVPVQSGSTTRPVAFVVPRPGASVKEVLVRQAVAGATGLDDAVGLEVIVLPVLPRTAAGKVDRRRLAADILGNV